MEMTRKEFHKNNTRILIYGIVIGTILGILIGLGAN